MALWIEHDLCYPNKLTDCVFFIEVLFMRLRVDTFWGKIMKKIHTTWYPVPGTTGTTVLITQ